MINLDVQKGERLDITKGTSIKKITVGLSWDAQDGPHTVDLDAAVFFRGTNGKVSSVNDVLYFKSPTDAKGFLNIYNSAVIHTGDELTGDKDGDDESIIFDLANIPAQAETGSVVVNIYDCVRKGQNFGQVNNAKVRIYNTETNETLFNYNMTEDYSAYTALHVCDIYRNGAEWKFAAKGEPKKHADLNGFFSEWS